MVCGTVHSEAACHKADKNTKIFRGFLGISTTMQALYEKIENAAIRRETVFITGQSGTGKKLCAKAIHQLGDRAHKPFVSVHCAAMGTKESAWRAEGGTVFFDGITEMPPNLQSEFLLSLKDFSARKIRIICATSSNPIAKISKNLFRQDLYYRLSILPLHLPPLCERGDDILDLALVLLRQYALEEGKKFKAFSNNAEFFLKAYEWPGNIRELQNVIKNIVIMNDGEIATDDMLPSIIFAKKSSSHSMELANSALSMVAGSSNSTHNRRVKPLAETEREAIEYAILYCNGNIPRAAELLKVAPSTIYRKKSAWENM